MENKGREVLGEEIERVIKELPLQKLAQDEFRKCFRESMETKNFTEFVSEKRQEEIAEEEYRKAFAKTIKRCFAKTEDEITNSIMSALGFKEVTE